MEQTNNPQQKTNCALATALRVIGVLNVIGGIIVGISHYEENIARPDKLFGTWTTTHYHPEMLILGILGGVFGCIICFALAKCVQAATIYLNSVVPKDKAVKPWLKDTVFDEEQTNTSQQD